MKKTIFFTLFTIFSFSAFCQTSGLNFSIEDRMNFREKLLTMTLDGVENSFIQIRNNTLLEGSFEPTIHGSTAVNNRAGLSLMGNIQVANDIGNAPIVSITSFVDNGQGVENNGYALPNNRHFFQIRGYNSSQGVNKYLLEIDHKGRVGIGTNIPRSKLEITNGDIYLSQASKGVIMTSPNGACWRMTVTNDGSPAFESISCPTYD